MEFKLNLEKAIGGFMLPTEIADSHLKLAGALQLRVILYCYRNMKTPIDVKAVSDFLNASEEDVKDALMFWSELGVLVCDNATQPVATKSEPTVKSVQPPKAPKPDRTEVARRGMECPEIAFLLNESQKKFGRMLKQSESSVLVWLYDDLGLSAALILMVIEYALQAGRCNISYIEKVAKDWSENGVETISDAEARIVELNNARSAWNVMRVAFGLDMRAPSDAEAKLAKQCVIEWKMERALLKKAYDSCVDSIGRYKASYIKTILTSWHKKGVKKVSDLEKLSDDKKAASKTARSGKGYTYDTVDMSLMDMIINED